MKTKTKGALDGMLRHKNEMTPTEREAFVITLARTTAALLISDAMQKKGINTKQLAEKMSMSSQRISQITSGNSNLSLDSLARIADALGLELQVSFK